MDSAQHVYRTPGPIFTCDIPVRWTDFDRFGHMSNSIYIEVAQEARMKFAFEHFVPRGMDIPTVFVRRLDVDYLAPILPDTTHVIVDTQVVALGHTSFTSRQKLKDRHGTICAIVEVVQVAMDIKKSEPRPITESEARALLPGEEMKALGEASPTDSTNPD